MRTLLDILIQYLYQYYFNQKGNNLVEMLKALNENIHLFPPTINIYLNTIRLTGNVAVYQQLVTKKDVESLLPLFIQVMEWFIRELLPNMNFEMEESNSESDNLSKNRIIDENIDKIELWNEIEIFSSQKKAIEQLSAKYNLDLETIYNENKSCGFTIKNGYVDILYLRDCDLNIVPDEFYPLHIYEFWI